MRRVLTFGLLALLLLSCASCTPQAKKRAVVRGHVLYRGAALAGGTIVFTPDAELGGDGPMALAEIKSDGSYSLLTGTEEGAAVGPYRVTIAADASEASKPAAVLPHEYSDPARSGLKREVKVGEANVIDFNLE